MSQATAEAGPSVEVDPYDPDDATAVEIAVGIAIAEALSPRPEVHKLTADQAEEIIESAASVALRFYAQRVLQLMIAQWSSTRAARPTGNPLDRVYAPVHDAVEGAVAQAIKETGTSVRDLVTAAVKRLEAAEAGAGLAVLLDVNAPQHEVEQLARADVVEQGYNDPEAQALDRLRVGMNSISRVLTTRTREAAKERYATAVGATGAVWRTRRDTRVRNSHGDLEGDFVPLGGTFRTVTGAEIRRPGDPKAPLHETIGCRCRLSYRLPPL